MFRDVPRRMIKKCVFVGSAGAALLLTGCAQVESQWDVFTDWFQPTEAITSVINPYRPDMHQGNLVTKEMVDQLHLGMTQLQVQFLLGIPLLRDMFHQNRWDYVYYMNPRFGDVQRRRLTLFFDDTGRLARYEFNPLPSETEADQMILGNDEVFQDDESQMTVVDPEQKAQDDIEQNAH